MNTYSPIAQSLEVVHSFTDPYKSSTAHTWLPDHFNLQPGFPFPLPTRYCTSCVNCALALQTAWVKQNLEVWLWGQSTPFP